MVAGPREQVGDPQTAVGAERLSVVLDGVEGGVQHEWYAELSDPAGHVTRSGVSTFTLPEAPALPAWDAGTVYTAGDEVTHRGVVWRTAWRTRDQQPGTPFGPWRPTP